MTEQQKIAEIKKKSEKELLESIAYDVDSIRGYVRYIGLCFLATDVIAAAIIIGLFVTKGF